MGLATPLPADMPERDASGADFARPAALLPAVLGLATPLPAAMPERDADGAEFAREMRILPGWPSLNVPQRCRVVGHETYLVDGVHEPVLTPFPGLILLFPPSCMLFRRNQSHKKVRVDVCLVSASVKLRANDDVRH